MSYELRHDRISGSVIGVRRLVDNAYIPRDENNTDWQAFLSWNAEQDPPLDLSDLPPPPRRQPKTIGRLVQEIEAWMGNGLPELRRAVSYALGIQLQSIPDLLKNEPGAPAGDEPA